MPNTSASLSVIIPTLNEERQLPETINQVRSLLSDSEIIIVDGGSVDRTLEIAREQNVACASTTPGRGTQMSEGAIQARGDLLLFLHADTRLPQNALPLIENFFKDPDHQIATFRLAFDDSNMFLKACAWLTRIDTVFTRFGDQGILIRKEFYRSLGGFPHWSLFEDVELLRKARRITHVWSLPASVTTSARRFRQRGILKQQWLNAHLLLRFLCGASPETLARRYRS